MSICMLCSRDEILPQIGVCSWWMGTISWMGDLAWQQSGFSIVLSKLPLVLCSEWEKNLDEYMRACAQAPLPKSICFVMADKHGRSSNTGLGLPNPLFLCLRPVDFQKNTMPLGRFKCQWMDVYCKHSLSLHLSDRSIYPRSMPVFDSLESSFSFFMVTSTETWMNDTS